jgi:hypothetical protein
MSTAPEELINSLEIQINIISCSHSFVITVSLFPHKHQTRYATGINGVHIFVVGY